MAFTIGAMLLVALLALLLASMLLSDGGPRPLPRRITTDDRPRRAPVQDLEIAVTDHRGDVDDGTSPSLGAWLTAGGVILAALVAAAIAGADV